MRYWVLAGLAACAYDEASSLGSVELRPGKNVCSGLREVEVRTHETMMTCLDMVQLNEFRRNRTLDIIRATLPFYVFEDLARNPRLAYPTSANLKWDLQGVDLDSELTRLYRQDFASERKFHFEVSQVLRKPLDGHLTYIPICFSSTKYFLPLALQSNYEKEEMFVTTVPGVMFGTKFIQYTQKLLGVDLSKYFGRRVKLIDGLDPIVALESMARTQIGVAKDASTRLNMMFLSPVVVDGVPNVSWGGFAAPPNTPLNSFVSMTFEDEVTLKLPYLTVTGFDYKDAKDFFISQCISAKRELSAQSEDDEEELNMNSYHFSVKKKQAFSHHEVPVKRKLKKVPSVGTFNGDEMVTTTQFAPYRPLNENFELNANSDLLGFLPHNPDILQTTSNQWVACFLLADNKTGVVAYPSNKVNTVSELTEFLEAFHSGLMQLRALGASRLILDVSHNTGGPICASLLLLDYLMGNSAPIYTSDMRRHPLSESLAQKAAEVEPGYRVWGPNSWMRDHRRTYSTNSWMTLPSSSPRGELLFSNPIIDRCPPSPIQSSPFPLSQISLLTNGVCLSSCSTLADGLIQAGVKSHSTDGLPRSPPCPHNMQGGQVYTYEKLYSDLLHFDLAHHPKAPPGPLPLKAVFGFTLREMFVMKASPLSHPPAISLQESNTPMEFLSSSSNYHHRSPPMKTIRPLDYFWNIVATYSDLPAE